MLEAVHPRLPVTFFDLFTGALNRWVRVYDHRDALERVETLRDWYAGDPEAEQYRLKVRRDRAKQMASRWEAELGIEFNRMSHQLEAKVAEVSKTRLYLVIGRLHGSSVYDGKQLPLMYRIQTVSGAPRTLGGRRRARRAPRPEG